MPIQRGMASVDSLRRTLDEFEEKYNVPSERLVDAFKDDTGRLQETPDMRSWSTVLSAYRICCGESVTAG